MRGATKKINLVLMPQPMMCSSGSLPSSYPHTLFFSSAVQLQHRAPTHGVPEGGYGGGGGGPSRDEWREQQLRQEQALVEDEHKQKMELLHQCLSQNIDDFSIRLARTMGPRRR